MRRSMGDRRMRPRFDIVGDLAGTFDASVVMFLRDIGRGGAQVESRISLPTGTLHRATLRCQGIDVPAQVCVRHVTPLLSSTGEQRFLIGVEFIGTSPQLVEAIEWWLVQHGNGAHVAGEPN